ncbi:hypothetical protein C2845_PM15G00920 [Panicum miliaceum]|uniref:DUF4220 domain-containing protein n=1 Tax=Panicum miliaceum TaxID=4540 RepID=A0A3L6Q445_PANMI|nr:hypothetical protein C2845_PM15G00920 [Panicum miliaceum]
MGPPSTGDAQLHAPSHAPRPCGVPQARRLRRAKDNITAYAIEDNQLWLRYLQTLVVQVAAAAYILYESLVIISSRSSLLRPATILMFVVGILKYGERVWALRYAGSTPSGSTYRSFDKSTASAVGPLPNLLDRDPEAFLSMAHLLLAAPMDMLKGPSTFVDVHCGTSAIPAEDLYKVAEVQLSLMHDVFYTKAEVTHTWYGLCIRVILPLGIIAALSLTRCFNYGARMVTVESMSL